MSDAIISDDRLLADKDARIAELTQQRDGLLAALKPICSEFAQQHPLIKAGRAAIASVESEK